MKKEVFFTLVLCSLTLAACSQKAFDDDDDDNDTLITQPITNNPLIVPDHGSGIPGMPSLPGQARTPGSPQ